VNKTGIEWTDMSSNPLYVVDKVTGKRGWFCEKVSPGCANCYASALNVRRGTGHAYLPEHRDKVEWRLNERELEAILRRRKPTRIFMCDMLDLFHEDVPFRWIGQIWRVMNDARQHTFMLLTKRPKRMLEFIRWMEASHHDRLAGAIEAGTWPLPNVWCGVSVENQRMADERIPVLLDTPAAVRFLSCEPLLGPLDLGPWLRPWPGYCQVCGGALKPPSATSCLACGSSDTDEGPPAPRRFERIDWVIVGGMSGGPESRWGKSWLVERCHCQPRAYTKNGTSWMGCNNCHGTGWRPKPQALEWVRSLRDQCVAAGVPFFFKQWGGPRPASGGRLLDGRTWRQMPMR